MQACVTWPYDIRGTAALLAAVAASVGLVVEFHAITVAVVWCMIMRLLYPQQQMLEYAAFMLAGFIFQLPMNTVGFAAYGLAYALFLAAVPIRAVPSSTADVTETREVSVVTDIEMDDL